MTNMPMHAPYQKIEEVYDVVRNNLPTDILDQLKFLAPDKLFKGNSLLVGRGRILGKPRNKIWSSTWCFYEIGIGRYGVAPGSKGGIGFVCFPNNKQCGEGRHRNLIRSSLEKLEDSYPKFRASGHQDAHQGIHKYYRYPEYDEFPIELAGQELAEVIKDTFPKFNLLGT